MLSIISDKRKPQWNTTSYSLGWLDKPKCCQGRGETGTPSYTAGKDVNGPVPLENSLAVPQMINIEIPQNSAIPLEYLPISEWKIKIHVHAKSWSQYLLTALFLTPKRRKQLKCLSSCNVLELQWWSLFNLVEILKNTDLDTLNWWILWYVIYILM